MRTRCPALRAGARTVPKLGSAVGVRDMLVEISPSYSAGLYGVPVKCWLQDKTQSLPLTQDTERKQKHPGA